MKTPPRILVADRNPHVRSFVQREMIKYGYRVRLARDGRDLFGWIDHPGMVDLLVLDPELPGSDGQRLLEKVHQSCPCLPIILHADNEISFSSGIRGKVVQINKSGNSIERLIKVIPEMLPAPQERGNNMDGCTVLFVDDEVDLVRSLVRRMEKRHIHAIGTNSGEEAMALLNSGKQAVDVVVLDVRMPGMDGVETLKAIREYDPLVEVILLSGHASLAVARVGMELGAFDYLMKPVDLDELLYKVQDAYRKKVIQEKKIRTLEKIDRA